MSSGCLNSETTGSQSKSTHELRPPKLGKDGAEKEGTDGKSKEAVLGESCACRSPFGNANLGTSSFGSSNSGILKVDDDAGESPTSFFVSFFSGIFGSGNLKDCWFVVAPVYTH